MRPRRAKTLNRLLVLAAFGALLTAGTGVAKADGILSDSERAYVSTYHDAVCQTLDSYPTYAGVMGIAQAIMDEGWAGDSTADIMNASVQGFCPRHWTLLVTIGETARAGQAGYKI